MGYEVNAVVDLLQAGAASGLAFGTGAAWVKELSADAGDRTAGPRRATVAMTLCGSSTDVRG